MFEDLDLIVEIERLRALELTDEEIEGYFEFFSPEENLDKETV